MFAKLLKYEFRSQRKTLTILSLAALGVGVLGALMSWLMQDSMATNDFSDTYFVSYLFYQLLAMGIMLSIGIYSLGVQVLLLYRFYRRCFSNEGYLTFTLPVTTHQVLLSSVVNMAIWGLISLVVSGISIGAFYMPSFFYYSEDLSYVAELLAPEPAFYAIIVCYLFYIVAAAVYSLLLPPLCITIGSLVAKKHKLLASFGIYYGLSTVLSFLTGILNIVTMFAAEISETGIYLSLCLPAVIYLCLGIGSYCIMYQLVDKKLNLT